MRSADPVRGTLLRGHRDEADVTAFRAPAALRDCDSDTVGRVLDLDVVETRLLEEVAHLVGRVERVDVRGKGRRDTLLIRVKAEHEAPAVREHSAQLAEVSAGIIPEVDSV